MAESDAFEKASALLEERTALSRLEARGTIRLALKQAGLKPASVRGSELVVVVRAVLPRELDARGIPEAASICEELCEGVAGIGDSSSGETPESVFSRLGGDS